MRNNNRNLIAAVLTAGLILAGAMFYLGFQIQTGDAKATTQADIEAGIEAYIAKQQAQAAKAQEEANKPKYYEGDFTDDDPVLGDPNAPVTIVEWSDFECPFCNRFFKNTLPEIKEKYIDTGKVKLVYRDFPLDFHNPLSTTESNAANCAREQGDDETYFAYHDKVFSTTTGNGRGLQVEQLYDMAEELGLDRNRFVECVESGKYDDEITKDIADGMRAGVQGTPAFLVNGLSVSGAQPFANFEQIIEDALSK